MIKKHYTKRNQNFSIWNILPIIAEQIVFGIFAIIIIYLFSLSIFSTCMVADTQNIFKHSFYLKDNFLIHVISISILLCLGLCVKKNKNKIRSVFSHKLEKVLVAAYVGLGICFVLFFRLYPIADQGEILKIAGQMANADFSEFQVGGYMSTNPHQNGLLLYVYLFYVFFRQNTYLVLQIFNIFFLVGSFWCILRSFKLIYGMEDTQISENVLLLGYLLFLPVFFYITYIYGTLPGLFFALLAILFQLKYDRYTKFTQMLGAVLCITISIIFKSNYLIFGIAMIIYAIYRALSKRLCKRELVFCALLVIILLGGKKATNEIMTQITGVPVNDGSPMISYVAMGLQDCAVAPGWWNGYNWNVYKENGYDSGLAKTAAEEVVAKRIKVFCNAPAAGVRIFIKKIASGWNNPTFQGLDILRGREGRNVCWGQIAQTARGKVLHVYMNLYHSFVLFGVVCWIWKKRNNHRFSELMFPMIVVGGFIFHLFWEMQCSYTLPYFLLLIPYSMKGYNFLLDYILNRLERQKYQITFRNGIILAMIIVFSALLINVVSGTELFTKTVGLNEEVEVYKEIYFKE